MDRLKMAQADIAMAALNIQNRLDPHYKGEPVSLFDVLAELAVAKESIEAWFSEDPRRVLDEAPEE